jgi:hypothetical protein
VHQKGWISDRFLNRIVSIATIIATVAALMVFFIPAAQESESITHAEMPVTPPPQTSKIDKDMNLYYADGISIEANATGSIIMRGHTELSKLVQFCPDEWVDDCGPNIEIKRKGDVFNLDKYALSRHQIAFNLQNANGLWLQISSTVVSLGRNLAINKGIHGSYFIYTPMTTKPVVPPIMSIPAGINQQNEQSGDDINASGNGIAIKQESNGAINIRR